MSRIPSHTTAIVKPRSDLKHKDDYLGLPKNDATVDVNGQRKAEAATVFARKAAERTLPGNYIQNQSGAWMEKQELLIAQKFKLRSWSWEPSSLASVLTTLGLGERHGGELSFAAPLRQKREHQGDPSHCNPQPAFH